MLERDKYLNQIEVKQLIKTCDAMAALDKEKGRSLWIRRRAMIYCLLYSGARVSEIRLLRCGDVKIGRECFLRVIGKGKRIREIPIGKVLKRVLKDYFLYKQYGLNEGTAPEDYLFTNRLNKPYTLAGAQLLFKKCTEAANLRECYSVHSTRHSYGFIQYSKTKNIRLVQHLLGHKRLETTVIYSHVDPNDIKTAVNDVW